MKSLFLFFCASIAASVLCGCKKTSAQLADQVKTEMQQEFVKKGGLKELVIEEVRLVKLAADGVDYSGVATGNINGEAVKFDVTCKYDGDSVVWNAELAEGCLAALEAKEVARDVGRKLRESWPKVKESLGRKYDAAAKSVAEGCDAARKSAGEFLDKAKAKAASLADSAAQKLSDQTKDGEAARQ